jgi:hypothetical protein
MEHDLITVADARRSELVRILLGGDREAGFVIPHDLSASEAALVREVLESVLKANCRSERLAS